MRQGFKRFIMLAIVGLLAACAQTRTAEHPSPARDFVVFFSADSTTLDPVAQQVIQGVAETAQQVAPRRLMIQAEASGDSAHAAFLAQERTKVVVQALGVAGVAQDRFDVRPAPRQPEQLGVIARRVVIKFEP